MSNWSDLGPRVTSGAAMSVVGILAIWFGSFVFWGLVLLAVGLMVWEILTICKLEPEQRRLFLPVAFSCVLFLCLMPLGLAVVSFIASLFLTYGLSLGLKQERVIGGVMLFAVFWVGYGLISFRSEHGIAFILWLLLVVVMSDMMGYFAGRTFGGPKFWPSISPKKTWSGTIAGWIGAAVVGIGFVVFNGSPALLIPMSILAAFAGQMGDIAESALKRRTGVKDSSNLIPGHGGVLDRFDAVSGTVLFVLLVSVFVPVAV